MSLDTFICGLCKVNFTELELFIKHKRKCIPTTTPTVLMVEEEPDTVPPAIEETVIEFTEASENKPGRGPGRPRKSLILVQARGRGRPRKGEKKIVPGDAVPKEPEKSPNEIRNRGRPRKGEENIQGDEAVPMEAEESPILIQARSRGRPRKGEEKNVQGDGELPLPAQTRSRGRPRKGEEKNVQVDAILGESPMAAHARSRGRPRKGEEITVLSTEAEESPILIQGDEIEDRSEEVVEVGEQEEDESNMDNAGDKSENHIQDIPVFNTEEEKLAFEQSLSVDLSAVDHMFRVSVIEQDLNENAATAPRTGPSAYLSLYACNTCDKVFKTLSHMRLHCLTHTSLKPFKCSECAYATSSKGSLYTHMRKHTGQFYMCSQCPFKTVNKSHLVEHVLIHSNVRHRCGICKKDYSSVKSLINHVRSYHSSTKIGQKYLAQFLAGRNVRGDTKVFHQCHVCNRKFKRKIDCDRHLFVHNIKDIPCMQRCELCNYAASRRKYLEKHFIKHQVIYCCCLCPDMFVSSVKLLEHITSAHIDSTAERTSESILEQSIGSSFYLLPENNSTTSSESRINNSNKDSRETEPIETSLVTSSTEITSSFQTGSTVPYPESIGTTTVTTSDAEIPGGVGMSGDPMRAEMLNQTSNVSRHVEIMGAELHEATVNGETDMDTSENGGIDNARVKVVVQERSDHPLPITDSLELETEIDMDTAAGHMQSNNDSSEAGETENGDILLIEDDDTSKSTKATDLIKRLGYHPLSVEIFKKMRQTFGIEECEFCGRFFNKRSDYELHVRIHTGDMPFQCDICDYRAMTRITLKRHVEREHDKKALKLPCKECDFVATDRQMFWNHQRKHQDIAGLECPECHKKFGILKKLRSHILLEHPTMSKKDVQRVAGPGPRKQKTKDMPFQCEVCDYRAMARITLKRHVRREHPKMNRPCKECDFAGKSRQQFLNHQRKHQVISVNLKTPVEQEQEQDKVTFSCKECEFVANSRTHLRNHELKHRGIISGLECPECHEKFKNLKKLRSHILTKHPMDSKDGVQQVPGPSLPKKKKIDNSGTANKTGDNLETESGGDKTKTKQMAVQQECIVKTEDTPADRDNC